MKLALTFLSLIILICGTTSAQSLATIENSDNEFIATFPVQVNFGVNPDGTFYSSRSENIGKTITIVGSFRNAGGQIEYRINTNEIKFYGDDRLINSLPTATAYEFIAREAVIQGAMLGLSETSDDCSAPVRTKVSAEACVTRMWQGSLTTIVPCTADQFSTWEYAVCMERGNSIPTTTRVPYQNMSICGGAIGSDCEPTCPTTDLSRIN